MIFLVTLHQET